MRCTRRPRSAASSTSAIGEEATIVGATQALRESDYLMSTYREHGQALARGTHAERRRWPSCSAVSTAARRAAAARCTCSTGTKRFLGGYGIVGGSLPLSAGVALACDYMETEDAILSMIGDGADEPGHLRRDDEPRRALEAAGRLPDHQQPVRHGHRARPPLGGHRPVAQGAGLRRAGHALRRHGRPRRARRVTSALEVRARGAQAAARRGRDLPLPRPLDGRPGGVPLEGRGRGVARARPDQGVRRAPRGRGRHLRGRVQGARREGDRGDRRGTEVRRRLAVPRARLALRRRVRRRLGRARLVDASTSARPRCTAASRSARPASCRTSWPRPARRTRTWATSRRASRRQEKGDEEEEQQQGGAEDENDPGGDEGGEGEASGDEPEAEGGAD